MKRVAERSTEALDHARRLVFKLSAADADVGAFRALARPLAREMLSTCDGRLSLLEEAEREGDEDAIRIVRIATNELVSRGTPLPLEFAAYWQRVLLRPPRLWPEGRDDMWSRMLIAALVDHVCRCHDLRPTGAVRKHTGCGIVAAALAAVGRPMSCGRIEEISRRYQQHVRGLEAFFRAASDAAVSLQVLSGGTDE